MKKIFLLFVFTCFFSANAEIYNLTRHKTWDEYSIDYMACDSLSLPAGDYHIKLISGVSGALNFHSGTFDNPGVRYYIFKLDGYGNGPGVGAEIDITIVEPVSTVLWGWQNGITDVTLEITDKNVCIPPVINSSLVISVGIGETATYTLSASGTAPIDKSYSGLPSYCSVSGDTLYISPTEDDLSSTVGLIASNACGQDSQFLAINVISDTCVPPVITSPSTMKVAEGNNKIYSVTYSGSNAVSVSIDHGSLPYYASSSGSSLIVSPPVGTAGDVFTVIASVDNACGSDSLDVVVTIVGEGEDDDDPPGKVDTDDDVPAINAAKEAIVSELQDIKSIVTIIKDDVSYIRTDISSIKSDVSNIKSNTSSIDTEIKKSNVFLEEIRDLLKPSDDPPPTPDDTDTPDTSNFPEVEDNSNIDLDAKRFFDGKFHGLETTLSPKGSESLELEIPVSQLFPGSGGPWAVPNWYLNFGIPPLSDWVFLFRSVLLGAIYLGTLFGAVKIFRTFEF